MNLLQSPLYSSFKLIIDMLILVHFQQDASLSLNYYFRDFDNKLGSIMVNLA